MPRAEFFTRLGFYVDPRFLDAAACARLRAVVQAAPATPAAVVPTLADKYQTTFLKEEVRKTDVVAVPAEVQAEVTARLMAVKPELERHFGLSLVGCQPLDFLVYHEGYHFKRHVDSYDNPAAPGWFRERKVSISVFLNGEADEADGCSYTGGSLTFHGQVQRGAQTIPLCFPMIGEAGLLVGFRSDQQHEVRPITSGTRYSIVTWFY